MKSSLSTRNIYVKLNDKDILNPNLDMRVTVTKSRLSIPNSAKIEIFMISEKTFIKLKKLPQIKIEIDGTLIFTGKVINVPNEFKGNSWTCTVYCNDIKTNPYTKPQYMNIAKGTSNEDALSLMTSALSDVKLDTSAFSKCQKAKGSLLKQMVVEYKKEADIMKAISNTFKGCDTEVVKEDGVVKLQSTSSVPNASKPIVFSRLMESPKLSHKDIVVKVPLNTKVKLGLGFKVKAKSISLQLESPYTYKNQFEDKTYRISEFIHTADNFTTSIASTFVKGLNFG